MPNQQTRKDFLNLGAVAGFSFLLGSQDLLGQKATAQTSNTEHPNVALIKRYYEAYGKGDVATRKWLISIIKANLYQGL